MQQSVFQLRRVDVQTISKHKAADEAAPGDTAVQEGLFGLVGHGLPLAGDGQLTTFKSDHQVVGAEAGDGQTDAHRPLAPLFDIVGRIAVRGGAGGAVDQGPRMVKAQQEGAVKQDGACRHRLLPPKQASGRLRLP